MWGINHLIRIFLCVLPFSAALSAEVLEDRDHDETYQYTKIGHAYVHDVKTYHKTSIRHCTVTKTAYKTHTKWTKPKHEFTTTITTTETKVAKTPYTSTIPASKGFIPIADSVPGASYDPAALNAKREAVATSPPEPLLARHGGWKGHGRWSDHEHGYPQKVEVVHWKHHPKCQVEHVTKTKHEEKCKGKASKTVTKIETTTTTKYPSTASPVYGACQKDNLANSYNGLPLVEFRAEVLANQDDPPGYTINMLRNLTSGYDCCAAAIHASPPAAIWGIGVAVNGDTRQPLCIILSLDGCKSPRKNPPLQKQGVTFEIRSSQTGFSDNLVLTGGNAYCGQWFRGCTVVDDGTDDGIEDCNPPKPAA